ncbi:cyclic nucleotide-binding domain-containing protein [Sinimarinibacterium sp. NLF-5-8]|uniref:cyclic nucleotide-binding domain-containing protein n=1 Tax=Sinimarinibacterium sp. NLF-5-8 TaxID=2698684 RepID=UPI00137C2471|nr:cyclic nucleotide-binding domain-containing protein [Sinimarinibacterium sp. NLF-5-8]QHS11203.1 cyclic nucleotide-binding domain-containing protein [Sinimarinibacterium sp. NLF-5-8]
MGNAARYRIAIVGSGPGGFSAACRAAQKGDSHILLEAQPHLSNTIYRYQKGKHVMAEPNVLPLRAETGFEAGSREAILAVWNADAERLGVNLRYRAEVRAIDRQDEGFVLTLGNGETILAETVILGIGVQGNPRKMGVPGEDLPNIQYQLDDPDAYKGETIVVIGAGDAAIENAVALSRQNTVHIVNRRDEFSRAKDGNNNLILSAIEQGKVRCHYNSAPEAVVALPGDDASGKPMRLRLSAAEGSVEVPCDRIIARLGATPQRAFVEACGITFPSEEADAVPQVSATYESNVPGLYIIGALAGYPLIKQAMNQGYEVVEFICGRPVEPADEPLLREKFTAFSATPDVDAFLDVMALRAPLLAAMNRLQLREFLLESRIFAPAEGTVLYRAGDYGNSVFIVVSGEVGVALGTQPDDALKPIKAGRIFGEMALVSGRPRSAPVIAGKGCVLVEVPRRAMLKLIASNARARAYVDRIFTTRALQRYLLPGVDDAQLKPIVDTATLCPFKAGESIYRIGDAANVIHLVRSGSVTTSVVAADGHEIVLQYHAAGQYFGELAVILGSARTQHAKAAIKTETIRIDAAPFLQLLDRQPQLRAALRERFRDQIEQRLQLERDPERSARMNFLLAQGLGEATDVLLIDEALCIRCDQCEKACAATHGNVSRLNREAGATFDNLHVPTSCRHCEHPHCMKDCPPDAIRRSPNGEVYIQDTCIGCGNCERNCPYGVIHMGVETQDEPSLWRWMLFGRGMAPGTDVHDYPAGSIKKAAKCDMCGSRDAGPACVQACPTGAAIRVAPEDFFKVLAHERD